MGESGAKGTDCLEKAASLYAQSELMPHPGQLSQAVRADGAISTHAPAVWRRVKRMHFVVQLVIAISSLFLLLALRLSCLLLPCTGRYRMTSLSALYAGPSYTVQYHLECLRKKQLTFDRVLADSKKILAQAHGAPLQWLFRHHMTAGNITPTTSTGQVGPKSDHTC